MNAFRRIGCRPLSLTSRDTPIGWLWSLRVPIWNGVQIEFLDHGKHRIVSVLDWRRFGTTRPVVVWQHFSH